MKNLLTPILIINFVIIVNQIFSQCSSLGYTVTPINGICASDGVINVQLPGGIPCVNWIAVLTPTSPSGPSQFSPINNLGSTSFISLAAGSYTVSLTQNGTPIPGSNQSAVLSTTYASQSVILALIPPTCAGGTNGTLTLSVAPGTGLANFTYELIAGPAPFTPSSSGAIVSNSYVFTGLKAGSYTYRVTDACGTVTISSVSVADGWLGSISGYYYKLIRKCSPNCNTYTSTFGGLSSPLLGAPTISGSIVVNGGAPIALTFTGGLEPWLGPDLNAGDQFQVTLTNGCATFTSPLTTVPAPNNAIFTVNNSVIPLLPYDCSTPTYGFSIRSQSGTAPNEVLHFCENTSVTVELESPTGSGNWVLVNPPVINPIPGVVMANGTFPNNLDWSTGFRITGLTSPGNYRVTANDGCHTQTRTILIPSASNTINTSYLTLAGTLLAGTRGVHVRIPNTNASPYKITVSSTSGVTSYTSSGPFNLAGTYPFNTHTYVSKIPGGGSAGFRSVFIQDLPAGSYDFFIEDACGNTTTKSITILPSDTLTYNPQISVSTGCPGTNSICVNLQPNNASFMNPSYISKLHQSVDGVAITVGGSNVANAIGQAPGSVGFSSGCYLNLASTPNAYRIFELDDSKGSGGSCFLTSDSTAYHFSVANETSACLMPRARTSIFTPPYLPITVAVQTGFCDISDPNSGIVVGEITDGTPVYLLQWEIFNSSNISLGIVIVNNASDPSALSHAFNGLSAGDYTLVTSHACISITTSFTIVAAGVIPPALSNDLVVCASNNSVDLSIPISPSVYDIVWTDDLSNTIGTGTPVSTLVTQNTVYTATFSINAAMAINCLFVGINASDIAVTFLPDPNLSSSVSDIDLCLTSAPYNVTIGNTQNGYSYELLDENGLSFSPQLIGVGNGGNLVIGNVPSATASSEYTVYISNGNSTGCDGILTDAVSFTSGTTNLGLTVNTNSPICEGDDAIITIVNSELGVTYEIFESGASMSPAITGTGTGANLVLTIPSNQINSGISTFLINTYGLGCLNSILQDIITIDNTPPIANAGPDVQITCLINSNGAIIGDEIPDPNYTYSWSPALGLGSTANSNSFAFPSSTTTYTLEVTNTTNGCSAFDQVQVIVDNTITNASAGPDQQINCISNQNGVTIGSSLESGYAYNWSPAIEMSSTTVSDPFVTPSSTTTYTVEVTNLANGCVASDQVQVIVDIVNPIANAGSDATITCLSNVDGAIIGNVDVSGQNLIYTWEPAIGLSSPNLAEPLAYPLTTTTYSLVVTNLSNGCISTDDVTVFVDNTPTHLSNYSDVCEGDQIALSPQSGGNWSSSNNMIATIDNFGTVTGINEGTVNFTYTNLSTGCISTTPTIQVNWTPLPSFNVNNSCVSLPISFINNTQPSSSNSFVQSWLWDFNSNSDVSSDKNPNYTYTFPGIYYPSLTAVTNKGCEYTVNYELEIFENPSFDFSSNILSGCTGTCFQFQNDIPNQNYLWELSDGQIFSTSSPVVCFNEESPFDQVFDVHLTVIDQNGCVSKVIKPNYITIYKQPTANFNQSNDQVDIIETTIDFTNLSLNADNYLWNFSNLGTSTEINPSFSFPDDIGGFYKTCLVAETIEGCYDTICKIIKVTNQPIYYVPNAFTPDNSNFNEVFKPIIFQGDYLENYKLQIYNRWGELLFESYDYNVGWNGTYNNSISQDGTYTWKLKFSLLGDVNIVEIIGNVTIIK